MCRGSLFSDTNGTTSNWETCARQTELGSRYSVTFSYSRELFSKLSLWNGIVHWQICMIATYLNNKVETNVSPIPDPIAISVSAMTMSSTGIFGYACISPVWLVFKVLCKVQKDKYRIIIITPDWSRQLTSAKPLRLALKKIYLGPSSQAGKYIQILARLYMNVCTWLLLGNPLQRKVLWKGNPTHCTCRKIENLIEQFMSPSWQSMLIDVSRKKFILS